MHIGWRNEPDMVIPIKKTKVLHVRQQEEPAPITAQEAIKECKCSCPHISCDFKFRTRRGMLVHSGSCPFKDEWEIDRIVNYRGEVFNRKYKIRWKGFTTYQGTWEPRSNNVHPDVIEKFEVVNGLYHYSNACTPGGSTNVNLLQWMHTVL